VAISNETRTASGSTVKAAIIGGAGFSGLELMHILSRHPHVEIGMVTSTKYAGRRVSDAFPEFKGLPHTFSKNDASVDGCDVAFLAIPNKASLEWAPKLLDRGMKVIDLSGVFRIPDIAVFQEFYKLEHTAPQALKEAVFGLPEAYREVIRKARLVANPGCYPTGALLGLLPFGEHLGQLAAPPIIDAKSGVTGAGGRVEDDSTNFMEVHDNFKAYKIFGHQHLPEIQHHLEQSTPYKAAKQGAVVFTPHLLPVARGILTSIVLRFKKPLDAAAIRQRFSDFAAREPFVTLLPAGESPDLKMVRYRNECVVSLHHDTSAETWIVMTAIDNIVKGASGQAVQNLNLMYGWDETAGLV
jgi:N-acetyl-gamma-glutamyl-phosphate reductase